MRQFQVENNYQELIRSVGYVVHARCKSIQYKAGVADVIYVTYKCDQFLYVCT